MGWFFETLDGAGSPGGNGRLTTHDVGQYNAVLNYGPQPQVWYYDAYARSLRHGWWNGVGWFFETLDGKGGPNGQTTVNVGLYSAVLLYGNAPHVWYYQASGKLRHGWWTGSFWAFEILDGQGTAPNGRTGDDVGQFNSVLMYGS